LWIAEVIDTAKEGCRAGLWGVEFRKAVEDSGVTVVSNAKK